MQGSPGSRALLAIRLGPEREEGQDPQPAAEHRQPPADEVTNHVHRFFLSLSLFFLFFTHSLAQNLAGVLAHPGPQAALAFVLDRLKVSINPPKKFFFFFPFLCAEPHFQLLLPTPNLSPAR